VAQKTRRRPAPNPQRVAVGHRDGGGASSPFHLSVAQGQIAHRAPARRPLSLTQQSDRYGPKQAVDLLRAAHPSGGSLQKPQRRSGASAHSSSTGGPRRSAHLYRVPGLLSAGDFGTAAAGPGSGTDRAGRNGEVRGGADVGCAHPHQRRPGGAPDSLHPTGTRVATAAEQAQTGVASATTSQDFLPRSWTPANKFVVPTFDVAALISNGLRKVPPPIREVGLGLLGLPSNPTARAWWIWAPLVALALLGTGLGVAADAANNEGLSYMGQTACAAAFGLAAVWLLGAGLARRGRALSIVLMALAFAAVSLLAFVVSPMWEQLWDLRRYEPAILLYLVMFWIAGGMVYAGGLNLTGWMCRRQFSCLRVLLRLPFWLWVMWVVAGSLLGCVMTFVLKD